MKKKWKIGFLSICILLLIATFFCSCSKSAIIGSWNREQNADNGRLYWRSDVDVSTSYILQFSFYRDGSFEMKRLTRLPDVMTGEEHAKYDDFYGKYEIINDGAALQLDVAENDVKDGIVIYPIEIEDGRMSLYTEDGVCTFMKH